MTMKVNRRSAFFSFTKAPVTGCPEALLTTPCTEPLSSAAQADCVAINTIPAIPTARFRVTFRRVMGLSLCMVPASSPVFRGDGVAATANAKMFGGKACRLDRPQHLNISGNRVIRYSDGKRLTESGRRAVPQASVRDECFSEESAPSGEERANEAPSEPRAVSR